MSRGRNIFGRILAVTGAFVFGYGLTSLVIVGRPLYWLYVVMGVWTIYMTREVWKHPLTKRVETVLDPHALAIAGLGFGLSDPIELIVADLPKGIEAFYRREGAIHTITVDRHLTPMELSKAIYHELYHAHICEDDFAGDGEAYHAATFAEALDAALAGYTSHQEEQAQTCELIHYDLPLTTHKVIA